MTHPSDVDLAALVDGGLLEEDARRLRAHLEACEACAEQARELRSLVGALAKTRPTEATWTPSRPTRRPVVVVALAAGVVLALSVVGASVVLPSDDGLQPRGEALRASVHAQIFVGHDDVERLAQSDRVRAHTGVNGLSLPLSVRVQALPDDAARHLAVVARDASGRVTWLMPTFASVPGRLRALERSARVFGGDLVVDVPVSEGPLELWTVVFDRDLGQARVDARFEEGWRPSQGEAGVRSVEFFMVFVETP